MEIKNNILVKVTDDDIKNGTFIIPENITEIGDSAFSGCKKLISIDIPDNVNIIGPSAFSYCFNLRKIIISKNVSEIGYFAFSRCELLSKVNIPDGVTSIGYRTFWDCKSLIKIELPDSIISIDDGAFNRCKNLKEITIPKKVTVISKDLFSGCSSLTSVNILGKVERICSNAFSGCINLRKMTIPSSIKVIEHCAFEDCIKYNLVLSSSLIYLSFENLDVHSLKVNNMLVNINNGKVQLGFDIRTIVKKELLKNIVNMLKANNINKKKHFKYKEHEVFIKIMIDRIVNGYEPNIEDELNNYINEYLDEKGLKIEDNIDYSKGALIYENQTINETNCGISNEMIVESNSIISQEKETQQENDIKVILKKLSELPTEDISLIMDLVKNNLFDPNIEKYINIGYEEKLKILELKSYKVNLEKEPIEEYKARQKVKH